MKQQTLKHSKQDFINLVAANPIAVTKYAFFLEDDLKWLERVVLVFYFKLLWRRNLCQSFSKVIPTQLDKTHNKPWEKSKETLVLVESVGIKARANTKPEISKTFIWWICEQNS